MNTFFSIHFVSVGTSKILNRFELKELDFEILQNIFTIYRPNLTLPNLMYPNLP